MKKILSLTLAVITAVMMLTISGGSFSAAEKLVINENLTTVVGDTIKYSIYVSDVPKKVEDAQLEIYYDSSKLTVSEDDINYIEGGSPVYNINIDGRVLFNSANGINGWDLKKRTLLFEVGFKVKKGGETDLSYYMQCMDYLDNSQNVDEITITCDYSINGTVVKAKQVPMVNPEGNGGIFVNYKNGKGKNNGGDEVVGGNKETDENQISSQEDGNIGEEVTEAKETQTALTETTVVKTNSSGVAFTTPEGEEVTWSESDEFWRNAGIVVLCGAIVCIIIIMVMINKKKKSDKDKK